jgi:hypothetical protein
MKVGIGTVAAQLLFWDYLFRIFGIVSLQCRVQDKSIMSLSLELFSVSLQLSEEVHLFINTEVERQSNLCAKEQSDKLVIYF